MDCLCRDRLGGEKKGSCFWGRGFWWGGVQLLGTESGSQDWSAQEVGTRPGCKT